MKIAIIGTGFSGLALARKLQQNKGDEIIFFEKSRGVGGRISTRYTNDYDYEFDHGAPFFEAKTQAFQDFLHQYIESGVVKKWNANCIDVDGRQSIQQETLLFCMEYFVGSPRMNSLPKVMSDGFDIKFETKITKILIDGKKKYLEDEKSRQYGAFDIVITAIPPVQSYDIIPDVCLYKTNLLQYEMLSKFVVMFGIERENHTFDIAKVRNSNIEMVVQNHRKVGRKGNPSIVIYSTMEFCMQNIDVEKSIIMEKMIAEYKVLFGKNEVISPQIHRWLYCVSKIQSNLFLLRDTKNGIFSCGDWLSSGTVEGAFLSGTKGADLLQNIKI